MIKINLSYAVDEYEYQHDFDIKFEIKKDQNTYHLIVIKSIIPENDNLGKTWYGKTEDGLMCNHLLKKISACANHPSQPTYITIHDGSTMAVEAMIDDQKIELKLRDSYAPNSVEHEFIKALETLCLSLISSPTLSSYIDAIKTSMIRYF